MAFTSVEYAILQDLQAIGTAALPNVAATKHVIRELPKASENIDSQLPLVVYTVHEDMTDDAISFEGDSGKVYTEEICYIEYREGDSESPMQAGQTARETLVRAVEKDSNNQFRNTLPLANLPSAATTANVWDVRIVRNAKLDRSKLNDNYAYSSIIVKVRTVE